MQTKSFFKNLNFLGLVQLLMSSLLKRILVLLLVAALCLSLSADASFAQEGEGGEVGSNLLQNPSFETGLAPWSGYGSPGIVGVQTCCAKEGVKSAYLEPGGSYKELYQNVTLNPGYRYRLKANIYTNGITANLGYYSTATGDVTCASTSSTTYKKLVCNFVIPYGAANFNVHVWANGPIGKRVTIDNLVLKQVNAGSHFVNGDLRYDQAAVYDSKDYKTWIYTGNKPDPPSSGDGFTTGWLGIDLADNDQTPAPNGNKYPKRFTQVGILTDHVGVRWFAWSEEGNYQAVQCLRGSNYWPGLGCAGNYNDLTSLHQWREVELVTYGQGFWIARIYDQNGNGYDVAKIFSGSQRVYRVQNTTEQAYQNVVGPAPNWRAEFNFYHPKYMTGTGFQDWPTSGGGAINTKNILHTWPLGICPNFMGSVNYEPRYWFAGTGGQTCNIDPLF